MAFASNQANYNDTKFETKNVSVNGESNQTIDKSSLNFYESMYHFKKMFPQFDSDVIEQILRSNDGAVDNTIDQLLGMSADYDSLKNDDKKLIVDMHDATSSVSFTESNYISNKDNGSIFETHDLPPSYNEFMSNVTKTESINESVLIQDSHPIIESNIESNNDFNKNKVPFNNNYQLSQLNDSNYPQNNEIFDVKLKNVSLDRSRVMIGELSKDFLRIKLNTDQVKKLKATIKKAKRNEITAIMNEELPCEPEKKPFSLEMKDKLYMLKGESNPDYSKVVVEENDDWELRTKNVYDNYEKKRIQIIQDEYLAKIMQNKEFLNELKQNKAFMQTLESDSEPIKMKFGENSNSNENRQLSMIQQNDYNRILGWETGDNRTNYSISNTELQKKLMKMSHKTRVKFMKLATNFTKQARKQYNKTAEQLTITCTNIFASQMRGIEYYNKNYNDLNTDKPLNSMPNRAQKAYKSFKTVMKRNAKSQLESITNSSTIYNDETLNVKKDGVKSSIALPGFEDYGYDRLEDQPTLPKIENFNIKFDSNGSPSSSLNDSGYRNNKNRKIPELDVFSNDYLYDDRSSDRREYTLDHSVYPSVKIFNQSTSKKMPDNFLNEERFK